MTNILLVEDDHDLANLVRDYLAKNDFNVDVVTDGLLAVETITSNQPDLVILDIMLPSLSGMDVCKQVRNGYLGPILMLTALDDDFDQMLGLELGADDYIIKPVQPRLLLTRVKTLLRRMSNQFSTPQHGKTNVEKLSIGSLAIDFTDRSVTISGQTIELTSAEYELLILLAQDFGRVVERNTIVQELRGLEYDGLDRSIDRRISRLRRKLQVGHFIHQDVIKTVRGKGYQLCGFNEK